MQRKLVLLNTRTENQERINHFAHNMSTEFIWWLVEEANKGNWNGEALGEAFCQLDSNNEIKLVTVEDGDLQRQLTQLRKTSEQNQAAINQSAHQMSPDFIRWLVQEANKGDWDGRALGEAFCQLDSNNKLKLSTVEDKELQKQLTMLNKEKTCLSAPLLGSSLQEWIYQEAEEGRWEKELVFRVLEKKETEGGAVVLARVKHLGMI